MNARSSHQSPSRFATLAAAAAAICTTVCLLAGIVFLFQRDGTPLEHVAAAERACAYRDYVSERQACVRDWLAAERRADVASR